MKRQTIKIEDCEISFCSLEDGQGNILQFWYTVVPAYPEPIAQQMCRIERAEGELLRLNRIDQSSVAAKRLFSTDIITQHQDLLSYKTRHSTDFFFSATQQPPASGSKVALLGMCLLNITAKFRDGRFFYFDTSSDIRHMFAEQIVDDSACEHSDSEQQTQKVFDILQDGLCRLGANIEDNVLRTWIYTPHVDADYPGIVDARKRFFESIRLTKDTHYIASTGIQGGSSSRFARVSLDAYAASGLAMEKIRYIQAPEHMCPTDAYGVTFERATAVALGSVDFLFISGTASIDKTGQIVHPGDVAGQTSRTLENITALLHASSFDKNDISSFIVYLRDPTDYSIARSIVNSFIPNLPCIYVTAPVCRPGWLIEIEATAARML